jgi:hypothetical protein
MNRLRPKLTYANVVSTICLFLLLGGGAAFAAIKLGKNTVGSKQIKKNAVTEAKIKDGAITGRKIAKGAVVDRAASADNAATVQGLTAAQITAGAKVGCPADTMPVAGFCLEKSSRPATAFSPATGDCAQDGRMLPPEGVMLAYLFGAIDREESRPPEWVGQEGAGGAGNAETLRVGEFIGVFVYEKKFISAEEERGYRCAILPTN